MNDVAWLLHSNGALDLKLCSDIPLTAKGIATCSTVFATGTQEPTSAASQSKALNMANKVTGEQPVNRRSLQIDHIITSKNSTGAVDGVNITYNDGANSVFLTQQCARVLVYPSEVVNSYKYEDIALLGAQFWLLVLSFMAIVFGSIPQILAVLSTRLLATAWSAYSIWFTIYHKDTFYRLVVAPGTSCAFNLFPTFFQIRIALGIADLVLNTTALAFTGYLGRHLIQVFGAFTFQRVGPPSHVVCIYRLFLALWVFLQLSVYFLITPIGLWITWLLNGSALGQITREATLYQALFIATVATLPLWVILGWHAVRREHKLLMVVFLLLCATYIACWLAMFRAHVYRWIFLQWTFFSCLTGVSFVVLIGTGVLGVLCWTKFGRGLGEFLRIEAALADADFSPALFSNKMEAGSEKQDLSRFSSMCSEPSSKITSRKDDSWDPFQVDQSPVIVISVQKDVSVLPR
ncbi:uncharacterized protein FIBRA_03011 [Fibroporia radiculosa]|uniref:Transmembrane protein n=1 Tax=Fibroporia radiculosa TaxID=599839 RepID=J4G3T4_9APHY|nr:uncharacterized protein FIBRA_03011 [Fibroporia radiculosa]CCM00963.1 predicted protein [Fibroporia radiculosa]